MPQLDQLSACPSCAEPLEEGDRFCGACGADLEAAARDLAAGAQDATQGRTPTLPDGLPTVPPPGQGGHASAPPPVPGPASAPPPVQGHASVPPPPPPPGWGHPSAPPPPSAPPAQPGAGAGAAPRQPAADGGEAFPPAGGPPPVSPSVSQPTEPDFTLPPAAGEPAAPPQPADAGPVPPAAEAGVPPGGAGSVPPIGAGPVPSVDGAGAPQAVGAGVPPGQDAGVPMPPAQGPAPSGPDPRAVSDDPARRTGAAHGVAGGPEPLGPTCVACGTGTIDDDGYCEHCGHKQPRDRDHMESALATVAAASDRGLRHHRNEDFYALAETTTGEGAPVTIAVVCDGVSSATRPDEASAAAAEAASAALRTALPQGRHVQQAMHDALVVAAEAVNELAADTPVDPAKNAPACTVVGALNCAGILTVGWIGDSRAYWVPDDPGAGAARLTEDDSWAAQMVAAGLMSEAEAYADPRAHAITGWLGADAYELDPHTASFQPESTGVVVVCTDGLWNYAESADEMAAALPPDAGTHPLHTARHLVGYALDGGGHDNVTVAVLPVPAPPAPSFAPPQGARQA
ncbi:protein phosphatase 2C domain-containing protein [Streptomyces diacarni]|uniref:protein phosphatase 2C domain-containing protein n=1 Tax=Streptomyces diacarni TaxID=2800381 RepID=UPI0033C6A9CA